MGILVRYLPVEVNPGVFFSENHILFRIDGVNYNAIVDERDLIGSLLRVLLIAVYEGIALIQLPRATFTTGTMIEIPLSMLQAI
jgi:hypothetical protein